MQWRSIVGAFIAVVAMNGEVLAQDPFLVQYGLGYGTTATEGGRFGIETADHGFLAVGGGPDALHAIFVVKTDANGNVTWQATYGDPVANIGAAGVVQTLDGGYVIGSGISPSPLPASLGSDDAMMIKIDANGVEQWRTVIGGSAGDGIYEIALAADDSVVGVGGTYSPEIPGVDPGAYAAYVVRVSDTGVVLDQRGFDHIVATEENEEAYKIVKTPDNGFMVMGSAYDGPGEWFLMKLDAGLNKLWGEFYGIEAVEGLNNTPDGGFIVSGINYDAEDAVLVKLDPNPGNPADPVVIRAGWPKTYSTPLYEVLYEAVATPDGGYFASGHHNLDPDIVSDHVWAVKVDANGDVEREGVFAEGYSYAVGTTFDGGYFVVGAILNLPMAPGGDDLYLLKLLDSTPTPGVVSGSVYFEEDATCSLTAGDVATRFRMVKLVDTLSTAAFLTMTDDSGAYAAPLPPGDYTATLAPNGVNQEPDTCGVDGLSYALSVTSNVTQPAKDFFSTCTCEIEDSLSGGPLDPAAFCASGIASTPCPSHPWEICYDVTNLCDKLAANNNGSFTKVCINLPPELEYNNGAPNVSGNGCTSTWSILPSTTSQVCFEQNAPFHFVTNCHHQICFPVDATANYAGGSITAQFETDANQCPAFPPTAPLDYGTMCSCDPNAMDVTPAGCGPSGAITSQELTYRVDFQNLGAGPAHDVVVTDRLDANLNPATFHVVDSSHAITNLVMNPFGELVVTFTGIELPAVIANAEGSHGHVTFAITPFEGSVDGTEIENSASIVFDANAPVVTNTVLNTLYEGDPVPVVDFEAAPNGDETDFSYTGGTTGATFAWDFGPHATPRTSTDQDPAGITFDGPGPRAVLLAATKGGCRAQTVKSVDVPCDTVWTASAFASPLGVRPRRVGSHLRLKFQLAYKDVAVTTQAQLDAILDNDFGRTPDGSCWPRVRVTSEDLMEEMALDADDFTGMPENPDGCFHFTRSGDLKLTLKLRKPKFEPATNYLIDVQDFTCRLSPGNNLLEMKP